MNINEIRAALATRANELHIQPVSKVQPISQEKPKPTKKPAPIRTKAAKAAPSVNPQTESKNTHPILAPVTTTSEKTATKAVDAFSIEQIVVENLQPGLDYNTIPGCGRKPALLKAGAEKLASIFNYRSTSRILNRVEQFDQLFVLYEVETTIYDKEGSVIAVGLGSCNSKERKYQRSDFAGNLNTILKMAKKRSYVDAILTACHGSGVFTQDIEDIASNVQSLSEAKEA